MKIAVPLENGAIAPELGESTSFAIFTAQDGKILSRENITLPAAGSTAVVSMIARQQINTLICGGLGLMTRSALQMIEVELIPMCTGDAETAAAKYLRGEAQGDPSILAVEPVEDENDPMQCMHDCAKCGGCGGDIPESVRAQLPKI